MGKKAFLTKVFNESSVTDDEIIKFVIKNYFLNGETLEDFQDDLVFKYRRDNKYAKRVKERFQNALEHYCL
jgi:hypothetical protein